MNIPKHMIRMIVAKNTYRRANHVRQILGLAAYQPRNLFEVIDGQELLQVLQEAFPIHLALVNPPILAQLEQGPSLEVLHSQFSQVALILIEEENDSGDTGSGKLLPDYILVPPVTAETLESSIATALHNRERRRLVTRAVEQGESLLRQGLPAEAQKCFDEAMHVGGQDPYAYYVLGDLFARRGETAQAIFAFRQAWERHPSYFEAIRHLVQLHRARGEGNAAIPYLEYAVKQGIAPVDSLLTLATLYLEAELSEKAQHTMQTALSADRTRALSALLEQARDLLERKGTAAAITLLQIGREVFPEQPQLYELLGDLLMEQQQPRAALVCYEHLLRLSDPHPANYCRLARAFLTMGFPIRAELAVQKARELDRSCEEAARLWAAIYG